MSTKNQHITLYLCILLLGISTRLFPQINFTEITTEAGINHHYLGVNEMGAGAAFFDMDNDGDEDLWLSGGLGNDVLYENDGNGYFTEIGNQAGLRATRNKVTTGVITGDLDNDGFKDVLVITHRGFPNIIFKNNGDKTFDELSGIGLENVEAYSLAAAMADINHDGLLDIYAGHYIEKDKLTYSSEVADSVVGFDHQCYANNLYLNNGDWTFTDVSDTWQASDMGCALATAFTDYDGDYDPDILIANDFGQWVLPNALLENQNEEDFFLDVSEFAQMNVGIYGMGIATGDYDNDLDLDYYITNLGENVLLSNNGDGTFSNQTIAAGIEDSHVTENLLATGWGTAFIDFDNDSDLDLYVVNGYVPAATFIDNALANPNRCFENDGQGRFRNILNGLTEESPERGRGLAYADIDNDGDIDFLVGNVNQHATSDTIQKMQLFRNISSNNHNWLKIKLEGSTNNRDGFGTQIRIKANNRWYLQEANGGYGTHASQHSSIVHFGLGTAEIIDSIVLFWQGGNRQILTQISANQFITIEEEAIISSINLPDERELVRLNCYPNPFHRSTTIDYRLPERSVVDLHIYDGLGKLVFQKAFPERLPGKQAFTWEAPENGIYFIRLKTDNQIVYKTIFSN